MMVETNINVGLSEIDKMGIVHNSIYPIWFEAGRRKYLKKAGLSNSSINARGLFLPLSEIECRYKCPARFKDELVVRTELTAMTCVKVKFEYQIFNRENGKLVASGRSVHAWTDRNIKPLNIEKNAPDIYRRLKRFAGSIDAAADGELL